MSKYSEENNSFDSQSGTFTSMWANCTKKENNISRIPLCNHSNQNLLIADAHRVPNNNGGSMTGLFVVFIVDL